MCFTLIHEMLEPFLPRGIIIPKLNRWFKELADYNNMYVNIKSKQWVDRWQLQVKYIKYLKEPLEYP